MPRCQCHHAGKTAQIAVSHASVNAKCGCFPSLMPEYIAMACTARQGTIERSMVYAKRLFATLLPALWLGGCAANDMSAFPSLAHRPIEQRVNVAASQPATPPVPEPVSATLAQALRALARDADAGDAAFRAELGEGRATIVAGRGAQEGSELWAASQMAYSRLDAVRGPSVFALAELDRLALSEAEAGHEDAAALIAAEQMRVAAVVAAQQQAMLEIRP